MSYDGMVTHSVVEELNQTVCGGKIDKIYQPERDEIILVIRTFTGHYRLLLSASAANARVHFTTVARENPMTPPMLCMLMRKHLQGGKIIRIVQQDFDRVIRMDIESHNELGDLCVKSIVIEIMGRHSNIILLQEDNKIMDSAKHVDFTVSAVRQILPGLHYEPPPAQEKMSPAVFSALELLNRLEACPADQLLDRFLLAEIMGLSPLLAREIVYRFTGNVKAAKEEVDTARFITHTESFLAGICADQYQPSLVLDSKDKKPVAFSCVHLTQYETAGMVQSLPSISAVIDTYYETRARQERMNQRSAALLKLVHNHIERCEKKLALHRENLEKSKNRDTYKIFGDLLTANLYRVKYGMEKIQVENYYSDPVEEVTVPLLADRSPAQNAQRYYKLYNKAKVTEKYALEQIEEAEAELAYLESVLESLEKAETPAELTEIREELSGQGYLPKAQAQHKKQQKKAEPLKFVSSDGYEILVGRNNTQNDMLTVRMAYSTDLWFHTKAIPGSHTIVRTRGGEHVPERTVLEAAQLAAYYSKAQNSANVPVDYTAIKNVKKPNGAKPGMVIYDHYNTLYVDPAPLAPAETPKQT